MLGITPSQGPWEKLWLFFPCRKIEADVNIKTGSLMELVKKGKELLKEETSKKETKL